MAYDPYKSCFGKRRYPDEKSARQTAHRREEEAKEEGRELKLRVYPCIDGLHPCGGYHLTSRDKIVEALY